MGKILLSLFLIFFVINTSSFSADKRLLSELTDISGEINANKLKLEKISTKILLIKPSIQNEFKNSIENIQESLTDIERILNNESQFILITPQIKEEYKIEFYKKRIEELLLSKGLIIVALDLLNYYYKNEMNNIFLNQFDNPVEIVDSTLTLIDRSVVILQSLKNGNN